MKLGARSSITATLLAAVIILVGCRHPLKLQGDGDIVELGESGRGCTLEQQAANDKACTENNVTADYVVTYWAIARPGWYFDRWTGTRCQLSPRPDMCEFAIPGNWVDFMDSRSTNAAVPPTTAVFKRIAGSSLTTFGWLNGDPGELADQFSARSLYKDKTQIPPDLDEEIALIDASLVLTQSYSSNDLYVDAQELANVLAQASGMSTWLPIEVVQDFRTIPYLAESQLYGAIALHDVIVLDGKFIDILVEYSNYLALLQAGLADVSELVAVDNIVAAHVSYLGTMPEFYYPYELLSPDLQDLAIYNLLSAFAALLYHEFSHLYFYHSLDAVRADETSDISDDVLITRTPVREDDADLAAGMLQARAELDEVRGRAMLDLIVYFIGYQNGIFVSSTEVLDTYQQTLVPGLTYSSLRDRKRNFSAGYARFLNAEAATSSTGEASLQAAEDLAAKAQGRPFRHSEASLQVPLEHVRALLERVCTSPDRCKSLMP